MKRKLLYKPIGNYWKGDLLQEARTCTSEDGKGQRHHRNDIPNNGDNLKRPTHF